MSNGPLAIVLDPLGYFYAEEEGIAFWKDANELWAHASLRPNDHFFSAKGSPWLMPQALQFRDDWYNDSRRAAHQLLANAWDFGANLTPKQEYLNQKQVGGAISPADESMSIHVPVNAGNAPVSIHLYPVPPGSGPPDPDPEHSIEQALLNSVGFKLPTDMVVVASTKTTLPGRKTPFFHLGAFPKPDEVFLFGFGYLCLVITRRALYVLKSSDDHQTWFYLASTAVDDAWLRFAYHEGDYPPIWSAGLAGPSPLPPNAIVHDVVFHDFGIVPIGNDQLLIASQSGQAFGIKAVNLFPPRSPDLKARDNEQAGEGKWWFAARKDSQIFVQVEKMAYEKAEHVTQFHIDNPPSGVPDFNTITKVVGPVMFNFGPGYRPTPAPEIFVDGLVHATLDTDGNMQENTVEDVTNDNGGLIGKTFRNAGSREILTVEVRDEQLQPWDNSDADPAKRHYSGYLRILLQPSDDFESCPQLLKATVRFPPVKKLRLRSLPDVQETIIIAESIGPTEGADAAEHHWTNLRVGCSKEDLTGKVVEFEVTETVYQPGFAGPGINKETPLEPYIRRQKFPFEIREDTDLDFSYRTTRIAGWVDKIEIAAESWQDKDGDGLPDTVTRTWTFHCYGLAKRLDQPWLFLSALEAPLNEGKLSHVNAVKIAFQQAGFDTENPRVFSAGDDSTQSEGERYLPGDQLHQVAVAGWRKRKNPYAPDPHQIRADYCETVAKGWSGWSLFEKLDGQINYIPDVINDIYLLGENPEILPPIRAHIYRSQDEADGYAEADQSAGRVPRLYMLEDPRPQVIPLAVQANTVAVSGKTADGELDSVVIIRDWNSIRGVKLDDNTFSANYENFVGEPKILSVVMDFAIDDFASSQVGYALLFDALLRGELLRIAVPFVPWDMRPVSIDSGASESLDVGDSIFCPGYGDYVILHSELSIAATKDPVTLYTCYRWPKPRPAVVP